MPAIELQCFTGAARADPACLPRVDNASAQPLVFDRAYVGEAVFASRQRVGVQGQYAYPVIRSCYLPLRRACATFGSRWFFSRGSTRATADTCRRPACPLDVVGVDEGPGKHPRIIHGNRVAFTGPCLKCNARRPPAIGPGRTIRVYRCVAGTVFPDANKLARTTRGGTRPCSVGEQRGGSCQDGKLVISILHLNSPQAPPDPSGRSASQQPHSR
ncbi:hypothetical protein SAMN05443247_08043 [Bradyrhizobium erythrophlei]|jgi:hypothetical protein|nr:hypothetical protein SAMN05443247_08043 [Bradyrhizobium erythrophlei]